MHERYVISFPDFFHFLIWRSTCFITYFHISTRQKLQGSKIHILLLTSRTCENNEKMKLSSTNKTHVYFLLVLFDVLRRYVATKKSFCVQYFILRLIQIIKFCKSLSYSPFRLTNVIKLSSSHKRFCRVVFKRLPLIPKSIFTGEYQHLYTCCFILIFISNLTCCMCIIKI